MIYDVFQSIFEKENRLLRYEKQEKKKNTYIKMLRQTEVVL